MIAPFTSPTDIMSSSYRRPYLNLKEKWTQIILNPYTVFLFFLILKIVFFINSLDDSFAQARKQTELLYLSTQSYVDNLASFPHYMAQGANIALAKGLEETNKGFVETLKLMLTATEEMIFFMIELSVGTYVCLLTAVIDSTAIAALNATEDVISVANDTLISFAKDLNTGLGDLSNAINDVIDTAEDTGDALKHMFGTSNTDNSKELKISENLAHVNLTIKNMQDWMIPDSINTDIEKLKGKILDFDDVKNYTQTLIDIPFKEIKKQINKNLNQTFDVDSFYVPDKKTIQLKNATDAIDKSYEAVQKLSIKTGHIIIGLIALAMLAFILYTFYFELRKWKRVNYASKELFIANESYAETPNKRKFNVEVISAMQDLTSDKLGRFISTKIIRMKNPIHINNMRWTISYMASPYLLSFLLLGLLGILSFVCQYIVLHIITNAHVLTDDVKRAFDNTAVEIKQAMNISIYDWSKETNYYLQNYQNEVNENLLGWIGTSTTAINNTVTKFDDQMNEVIDAIFKGTPLYDPVEKIVWCVIESKLKKIESAMTWLNENAKLDIGDLDPEDISNKLREMNESNGDSDELGNKVSDFKDKATGLFLHVLEFYKKETFLMLYISLGILGVWLLFVLFGLLILLFREWEITKHESLETEKGSPTNILDVNSFKKYSAAISPKGLVTAVSIPNTLTDLYQNVKDIYLQRDNYIRTPVEPIQNNKEVSDLRETFEAENKDESWNSIWDKITLPSDGADIFEDQFVDTTLSDIEENSISVQYARRWTP